MRKRGQSAIEFVILVGAVIFFFLTFLYAIQNNISDKVGENKDLIVQDIARTVQDELNLALESSEGYSRMFTIPQQVVNVNYDISLVDGAVYVVTEDGKHAIALPIVEVTGTINPGDNFIIKELGVVYLNEAPP
jgi:hypothetical protein